MQNPEHPPDVVEAWLEALEARHLAEFTRSEVARALRALSSCYVERRAKLTGGGALATAGKRAAFALFYAPQHFLIAREIVRAIPGAAEGLRQVYDLGCGTGSAGAAWALEGTRVRVAGVDRHPWAVAEANWTYRQLGIDGRAVQQPMDRTRLEARTGTAILAAYAINELEDEARAAMLERLLDAHARGARVLVVEPIARRLTPWWAGWERAFAGAGGRAAEWRFKTPLPARQQELARAAGLDPRELTARSLYL